MRRRTRRLLQDDSIIDEQEQEEIIEDLHTDNITATKYLKLSIAVLSLCITLPMAFLTNRRNLLLHMLSITSLSMTAFTLRYGPDGQPSMAHGPLIRYADSLNSALTIVVLLMTYFKTESMHWTGLFQSFHILPLSMHGISMLLRYSAAQTTHEIEALKRQKYNLQGA